MRLRMYQKIVLNDGKKAHIVEIFNDGEAYMVDVLLSEGDLSIEPPIYPEYETITITPKDIRSVIVEVEEPFVQWQFATT